MKKLIVFLFAIAVLSCNAQKSTLDGKVYTIENYINGKLDNTEDVTFEDGKMEGSVCTLYGFKAATYQTVKQGKDDLSFESIMYSEKEGKMVWKGKVTGDRIEGTCLWSKDGQDPILFTFKGNQK